MDAPFAGAPALPHAGATRAELEALLRQALARGLHGLCFGAYLPGQSPEQGSQLDEAQIRARLELIRPFTRWVRSFSCTDGNQLTPRLAHQLGLKTMVGAWLGADREKNEVELAAAIEVARAGHADLLAIGNEVLLREDLPEAELIGYLERARAAAPGVPVGYVDAYYLFCQHPRLVAACDVLLINCYPFWEYCALEHALAYMKEMVARVERVAGGRRIIISETGWPSAGTPVGAAVPSVENALRYLLATLEWTDAAGLDLFYFAAFDEAWKAGAEGDRGVTWGLWDQDGRPKYGG
ncbi:MAG: glycosyl hydrolase [Anaeromyxobacter sp.]|nr:glycosyl hydrolase [Anaeromyxobacter sp.]